MTCPDCGIIKDKDGNEVKGKVFCHVNRGNKPHSWEFLNCPRCDGTGEIPDEAVKWIKHGEVIRKKRLSENETIRDVAIRLKTSPVFISEVERGKIYNLDIVSWDDYSEKIPHVERGADW